MALGIREIVTLISSFYGPPDWEWLYLFIVPGCMPLIVAHKPCEFLVGPIRDHVLDVFQFKDCPVTVHLSPIFQVFGGRFIAAEINGASN